MRRKTIILSAAIVTLVAGVVTAWPRVEYYMITGSFSPIQKIESLRNPVGVTKWDADGLILADGRKMQLVGLRSLPSESSALAEATKRGVEIDVDGRVWGLVRVHHWCGNDPVREHVARVDLAEMLTFLRVGDLLVPVAEPQFLAYEPGGDFSNWGWSVGEFMQFERWQKFKASAP